MWKVNNWKSLQSYKDRKPPWIRLHKTLLDNFEFHSMSKNAKALLPMFWLLASEHDDPTSGIIKYNIDQISFRLRATKKDAKEAIDECVSFGFLEQIQPCIESVTKSLRNSSSTVTPETETETEKRQTWGEFKNVPLTEEQHVKLTTRFNSHTDELIEEMSAYIAQSGKKYKDHYAALINWGKRKGYDKTKDSKEEYNFV